MGDSQSSDCTDVLKVTLDDVTRFLEDGNLEQSVDNLTERTDCAILLLQTLPCARHAILERLSDVFYDVSKRYVLEMERQHLAGLPSVVENCGSRQENQALKIKDVLVASVNANVKAWAKMVFQWSVKTLGYICGQYATARQFASYTLHDRVQLWLNCSATKILLEVCVSSASHLVGQEQDGVMQVLLSVTIQHSPYFDWALAYTCGYFHRVLPYELLSSTLKAFSSQSRKAELIIETAITICNYLLPQRRDVIEQSLYQLFEEGMVYNADASKEKKHRALCTFPFLLHVAVSSPSLANISIEKVVDGLSHRYLQILLEQSSKRDAVLQRGMLPRTVDCIKRLTNGTFKVLQFLIKYACKEDQKLHASDANLSHSAQTICSIILDMLIQQLYHEVAVYNQIKRYPGVASKPAKPEESNKNPFLAGLASYSKQLCQQLINATGTKKRILKEFLKLACCQEGDTLMVEVLTSLLINSRSEENLACFLYMEEQFWICSPNILKQTLEKLFVRVSAPGQGYTVSQVAVFFHNLKSLVDHERRHVAQWPRSKSLEQILKRKLKFIGLTVLGNASNQAGEEAVELLNMLCGHDLALPVADSSLIARGVVYFYFQNLNKLIEKSQVQHDMKGMCNTIKKCDAILVAMVKANPIMQQLVLRLLMEGRLESGSCDENLAQEPFASSAHVSLLDENYNRNSSDIRFGSSVTSVVCHKVGLNKRKFETSNNCGQAMDSHLADQLFINSLSQLLSLPSIFGASMDVNADDISFPRAWTEKTFSRPFPSAYAYLATLLVESVCPEVLPVQPWPEEDFLKYTIERDVKVRNRFDQHPILWEVMDLIAAARPALYHCSVLIQSLLGLCLKYWDSDRRLLAAHSPKELENTSRVINMIQMAGWLPTDLDTVAGIFHMLKPKEVYTILSAVWLYLKASSFSSDRFVERDRLGRPQLPTKAENLQLVKTVLKDVFIRNIAKLGPFYHRFFQEAQTGV